MTRILACVDRSLCAAGVVATAEWFATLLDATVDQVRVGDNDIGADDNALVRHLRGAPEEVLAVELAAPDVVMGVAGARSAGSKRHVAGHVTKALLADALVPLVVLPPHAAPPARGSPTVLVPLDGTADTAAALLPVAKDLAAVGGVVVLAHVFDQESLPPFIGSAQDFEILAREFIEMHLPGLVEECVLRIGDPSSEIMKLIIEMEPACVLTAWHKNLEHGRAEVLRRLLRECPTPVIVVPIAGSSGR